MSVSLETLAGKLDALHAVVLGLSRQQSATNPALRAQYGVKEFAEKIGVSPARLGRREVWKRYGGVKRGGRVFFSAASLLAVQTGGKA